MATAKKPAPAKRAAKLTDAEVIGGGKKVKVNRSAKTGRVVSKAVAQANPDTTVTETVTRKGKKPAFKIPKALAEAVDLYKTTRDLRLAEQKRVDEIAEQEKLLKQHIIDTLPKSQANGIAGKLARAEITKRNVPIIEDERKFFAYAHRKGNEDLVKESMVVSAVQARWEAGKAVPGIGTFTVVNLSLTTLK